MPGSWRGKSATTQNRSLALLSLLTSRLRRTQQWLSQQKGNLKLQLRKSGREDSVNKLGHPRTTVHLHRCKKFACLGSGSHFCEVERRGTDRRLRTERGPWLVAHHPQVGQRRFQEVLRRNALEASRSLFTKCASLMFFALPSPLLEPPGCHQRQRRQALLALLLALRCEPEERRNQEER